jgi:hypothetical protein
MRCLVFLLMMAPAVAAAIDLPIVLPKEPTRCVFEGVFPGSGMQGRWEYHSVDAGSYRVEIPDSAVLMGVIGRRVGDQVTAIVRWQMTGQEHFRTPLLTESLRLEAQLEFADGKKALLRDTVEIERHCSGFPRKAAVGDAWRCKEIVTDGWSIEPAITGTSSGESRHLSEVSYRYVKDEAKTFAGASISAAVIDADDGKGNKWREWRDPKHPWCALDVQRHKLGRVVGRDRLISRAIGAKETVNREKRPPHPYSWDWLYISLGVVIAGVVVVRLSLREG